ncbi:hypothetical protein F5876DRAFT_33715 [Lentinula aff. lateritia]|uniref:Uncharacterized protein n=1 Tax=Lentinula aff. lateritia TaxID=2804960 RepID=A0ACC1UAS5_9AGAR|nr:hypothetical protein F5876DRAFT_33715 [Lentinula aff. lateritia]
MTAVLALSSRSALKAVTRTLVSRAVGPVATTSMSTMHDNDPDVLDTEKKRNLSKTQHGTSTPHEHAPGWNEYLASASEAHVKADRSTASPSELADKTIKYIHERHSPENAVQPTEASFSRDAVDGPLGQAEGHDEVVEKTVEKKKSTTKVFSSSTD